jgi:hypothetical protein
MSQDQPQNTTAYVHPRDPNLNSLEKVMEYSDGVQPHLRVSLGSDSITVTGSVNIASEIRINNTELQSIPVHLTDDPIAVTGTFWQTTQPVSGTVSLDANSLSALENINATVSGTVSIGSNGTVSLSADTLSALENINATVSGTVELGATTLSALENITVSGSVSVGNFPASQAVTGTFWQATQPVSIASLPEIEIKNDTGNPIPVTGNVTTTITDVITVVVNEDAGDKYSFNNHAANATRGWTMDNTMRPVVSFQNGSANAADIIKILEYEIGNNNANQSTIVYEWYEGPLTIAGAAIPAWTTFGQHSQYRVYQDQYSSNQGNTFTVPAGTYMRHSGIIIGKNTSGDEGPASLYGGSSRNMLTLCMRRVDNATKLDVWFAFTVKELA